MVTACSAYSLRQPERAKLADAGPVDRPSRGRQDDGTGPAPASLVERQAKNGQDSTKG